jgi:hypothetical protein
MRGVHAHGCYLAGTRPNIAERLQFVQTFNMICGDRVGSTAVDRPKLTLEQLADITDEQQITDIRATAEVALATFDAWRQSPAWNRHEKHYQQWGVLVDRVALVLAELPTDADLRTVIDAVRPLLNEWFPSSGEQEVTFSAAVDRLRYLTMWRPDHIHQARISTGREPYDGPGPEPTWTTPN